ncbi:MAG: hypothetical protein ACE5LL_02435, partial [Alphaproteobacteria bacterium]
LEAVMPKWLTPLLKWGGICLFVFFVAALIIVRATAPTPEAGAPPTEIAAPVVLYWILVVVGLVAAILGFVLERRKPPAGA